MLGSGLKTVLNHPYNRAHPLSAVFRYLEWQIRKRLGRPWNKSFWGDRLLTLWPDSGDSMWLLYNVLMDWPEFPFLEKYLRPGDTVIDIGANIGVYSLWISRFVGIKGKIIAFEPARECFTRLVRQCAQNGLTQIVPENLAVSSKSGNIQLTSGRDLENYIAVNNLPSETLQHVEAISLDSYLKAVSIDEVSFLKIDVEGAEPLVLEGADLSLREQRIALIQFEVGEHWARYGYHLVDVTNKLKHFGYIPFAPDESGNDICRIGDWGAAIRGQNLFVARSIPEILMRVKDHCTI